MRMPAFMCGTDVSALDLRDVLDERSDPLLTGKRKADMKQHTFAQIGVSDRAKFARRQQRADRLWCVIDKAHAGNG